MRSLSSKKSKGRWDKNIQEIIAKAISGSEFFTLSVLGRAIRGFESTKSRSEYISKRLKEKTLEFMEIYGIDEIRITLRTFIRRDLVFTIPDDDEGRTIYKKVISLFGREMADKLITKAHKEIPARKVISYAVNDQTLQELDDHKKVILAKAIGNTPRLFVGETPKRVKTGKKRTRKGKPK